MTDSEKEIIVLSERFHPDTTSASGQYMTDISIGLQKRGLDVTVLTRAINGDGSESTREGIENTNIDIKRVPISGVDRDHFIKRLYNWFTYLAIVLPLLLVSSSNKEREIVFVSYPTIMPPFVWAVCKLRGWDYMYIVHDYHPEAAIELGYIKRNGIIHRIWERVNQYLLIDATHIVALGPKMKDEIINSVDRKYERKFDPEKVSVIHNWADGEFIEPKEKENNWFSKEHGLVNKFSLVYSGNIGEFHDLETVIRAVAKIDQDDTHLMVIGEGDNKGNIIELAKRTEVLGEKVSVLPYQPWEDVPYSITAGDVSIVAVNPEFKGLCVSSKLYSALASGQPVLVIADEHDDESQIISRYNAGIQVSPGDPQAAIDAINQWKNNPELVREHGENAREAFENHFTQENSIDKYYKLLSE
ncbi:glycosyltransferase family 4 protein [Halosolutus halophilus]|uniref:glycosyltransferase family 4 protein n=1 Tax=Halosolutus halophilus TaxID=1552990 RepID=UPI0022352CBF|nr:glycosyltransferase family 4 protein [Halosolutus halophilus]